MILTEYIEMKQFTTVDKFALPKAATILYEQETSIDNIATEASEQNQHLEHPLFVLPMEKVEEEAPKNQREVVKATKYENNYYPIITSDIFENIEIEMEVFPPSGLTESEVLKMTENPSAMFTTPEMVVPVAHGMTRPSKLKWKRIPPTKTSLVVKDVICLPRGYYLSQEDRHTVPKGKERSELAAMGLITRMTIDNSWLPHEMESRISSLFRSRFCSGYDQTFTFTYLQCLQGSRVLFVPDTQLQWSGEQVLKIAGHGPLFILCHLDFSSEIECKWQRNRAPVITRHDYSLGDHKDDKVKRVESTRPATPVEEDLNAILQTYREQNATPEIQIHMYLRRRNIFRSAVKGMGKKSFSIKASPVFHFKGEKDDDWPRREYFRLIMLGLQESSILEGRRGHLLFAYDQDALEERRYHTAGVMVAWSLLHGGPGPNCLHKSLYLLMCGHSPSLEDFSCTDIADVDVQMKLQQISSTSFQRLTPNLCEWIADCGIPGIYRAKTKDMTSIYTHLVIHWIYHRVASMISQFTEGLNSCGGMWDIMKANSAAFMPVMTRTEHVLTLKQFRSLFEVFWSPLESTGPRQAEEITITSWERFLIMVNEQHTSLSLVDLLVFITGEDQIPPLGFHKKLSIRFYNHGQDHHHAVYNVCLPHASTCALELHLPRGVASPSGLKFMLTRAVNKSLGLN